MSVQAWQATKTQSELTTVLQESESLALKYPNDGAVVSLLGWIYSLSERSAEAELMLARATQLSPRLSSDQAFFMADQLRQRDDTESKERALEILESLEAEQFEFFQLHKLAHETLEILRLELHLPTKNKVLVRET